MSAQIEASVLACLILCRKDRPWLSASLTNELFQEDTHQRIYHAINDLLIDGQEPDTALLEAQLRRNGDLDRIGGIVRLAAVMAADTINDRPRLRSYLTELRREARRRQMHMLGLELQDKAKAADDPEQLAELAQARLADPSLADPNEQYSPEALAVLAWSDYEQIRTRRARGMPCLGVPTGFHRTDRMLNGLVPGQLTVVAARSSVGKSTWMLQAAHYACCLDRPIAYLAAEETRTTLLKRAACMRAELCPMDERDGTLSSGDELAYHAALQRVASSSLRLYDDCRNIAAVTQRIATLRRDGELDAVFVDHLHALAGPGENPYAIRTHVTQALKGLAMEHEVAVVLGCQLNRQAEQRTDRWPDQGDLRDSSSIMEIADNLILLHRPGANQAVLKACKTQEQRQDLSEEAYAIIDKQRIGGQTGTLKMHWDNRLKQFEEIPP